MVVEAIGLETSMSMWGILSMPYVTSLDSVLSVNSIFTLLWDVHLDVSWMTKYGIKLTELRFLRNSPSAFKLEDPSSNLQQMYPVHLNLPLR